MVEATPSTMGITVPALKGLVTASSLFIAGGMASTSLQFLPALIAAAKSPASLSKAGRPSKSARLTPQSTPSVEKEDFSLNGAASTSNSATGDGTSKSHILAAQQFSLMSKAAFASQVPFELLSIVSAGYLAVHLRAIGERGWQKWAVVAGLVASIFPYTRILMVPLDHKIARVGGDEDKVEPYDDAPLDREMEKTNTVDFLTKWNILNSMRALHMSIAGGIGVWALCE